MNLVLSQNENSFDALRNNNSLFLHYTFFCIVKKIIPNRKSVMNGKPVTSALIETPET